MAIVNGYCTLSELKNLIGSIPTSLESHVEDIITAVSRLIETDPAMQKGGTGRRFFSTDADETRYFTPKNSYRVRITDLVQVTSVAIDTGNRTFSASLSATDYDLKPFEAPLLGQPYTEIAVSPVSSVRFYCIPKSLRIVGRFGYNLGDSTVCPAEIKQACLIQCARIYNRKSTPFGLAGESKAGQNTVLVKIPRIDPDVSDMIAGFRRRTFL